MRREYLWALLTLIIAVVLAFALLSAARDETRSEGNLPCITGEDQEKILRMSLRAVDQAFQHHVNNLFSNWVLDASQQPSRAQKGMQNGIKAWLRAQDDAKKWIPAICP